MIEQQIKQLCALFNIGLTVYSYSRTTQAILYKPLFLGDLP